MSGAPVDPANSDAYRAWDGADGDFWAENADAFDDGMHRFVEPLMAGAALAPGERVLDIGCGNGVTTLEAARRASPGRAMGLDLSTAMLEVARGRAVAAQVLNLEFVQADAQVYPFVPASFDVVLSRFGVMFFADPAASFANIARAVRSGGRLAFMVWQAAAVNPWMQVIGKSLAAGRELPTPPPDAPSPFALADPGRVRALLGDAGFANVTLEPVLQPMGFGRDVETALAFVSGLPGARGLLKDLSEKDRAEGLAKLRAALEAQLTPDGVLLDSRAWLVTAARS